MNQLTFGSELSKSQVDAALIKLQALMNDEPIQKPKLFEKPHERSQDEIMRSIQKMATETSEEVPMPKISIEQFNQLIGRLYDKQQQVNDKVQIQREQKEKSPFKPTISTASQKIMQKKIQQGQYRPIYERTQTIVEEKRQKQQEAEKMKSLQADQEKIHYTFKPNVHTGEPRSVEQFLEQVDYWINKKNEQLAVQQQEKFIKETSELTFKPKLNKKSEQIVHDSLNCTFYDRNVKSSMQRQLKERKLLEEQLKQTPFAPKLNPKSLHIATKSPHRQQHNYLNQSYFEDPMKSNRTPTRCKTPNLRNRSVSPLSNNKTILNRVQEIKYTPNAKFLVDLADKKALR